MTDKAYALFETQSDAQRLHKAMKDLKIPHDISPTPRDLSRSCGMALRFDASDIPAVSETAEAIGVSIEIARRRRA